MRTYITVWPRWPAVMRPASTACVPWYRPQSRARGGGDDDEAHQQRARAHAALGGVEGVFGGGIEARRLARLGGVALHHGDGVQHLGGNGAGVRHPVLAGAREAAHAAAEPDAGQHHQQQHGQHLRHDVGVGPDQHGQRAQARHRAAQAHGEATSPPPSAPAWCRWSGATAPRRSAWSRRIPGFAAARGRRRRCARRRSRVRPASSSGKSARPRTRPWPRPRQTAGRSARAGPAAARRVPATAGRRRSDRAGRAERPAWRWLPAPGTARPARCGCGRDAERAAGLSRTCGVAGAGAGRTHGFSGRQGGGPAYTGEPRLRPAAHRGSHLAAGLYCLTIIA